MFVVFEGIDGSGKTTISNRVAKALREKAVTVSHVREGGKLASNVAQAIRDLCRDSRNLTLSPWAELLLYAAREVQLTEEAIMPELERSSIVIADRFLYTAEVLARDGRGLPGPALRAILDGIAAGAQPGVRPDVVILIDVDPSVARGRRKISKAMSAERRPPSRKGLAGSGLQQRLRDGYRELAAGDPGRWVVIDNSEQDLGSIVERVVALLMTAHQRGPAAAIAELRAQEAGAGDGGLAVPAAVATSGSRRLETPRQALAAFLDWVDRRAVVEPQLAAYVLAGLSGPGIDERRVALAAVAPTLIARGLKGMADAVSWRLRRQLAAVAPREVALSLLEEGAAEAPEAWRLRHELEGVAPAEVAASLEGLDDEAAWAMRERLAPSVPDAVMLSLALLAGPRAAEMRERWLAERGGLSGPALASYDGGRVACRAVTGLDDERSWQIRRAACAGSPVAALVSLRGTDSERSWSWRERYLAWAPRAVLSTIAGLDDPRAWTMREATAPRCREALDSMIGLDHAIAWRLRETYLDLWPATAIKSLGVLVSGARGNQLLLRALAAHADSISLLKQAAAIASGGDLNPHVMAA
jgi:dTMP kinase